MLSRPEISAVLSAFGSSLHAWGFWLGARRQRGCRCRIRKGSGSSNAWRPVSGSREPGRQAPDTSTGLLYCSFQAGEIDEKVSFSKGEFLNPGGLSSSSQTVRRRVVGRQVGKVRAVVRIVWGSGRGFPARKGHRCRSAEAGLDCPETREANERTLAAPGTCVRRGPRPSRSEVPNQDGADTD